MHKPPDESLAGITDPRTYELRNVGNKFPILLDGAIIGSIEKASTDFGAIWVDDRSYRMYYHAPSAEGELGWAHILQIEGSRVRAGLHYDSY